MQPSKILQCVLGTLVVSNVIYLMTSRPSSELDVFSVLTGRVDTLNPSQAVANDGGATLIAKEEFLCGNDSWQERYAEIHEGILNGSLPQKFFIHRTWVYGLGDNRMGITWAFYAAVMTNRAFVLQVVPQIHINQFWLPNKVDWDIYDEFGPPPKSTSELWDNKTWTMTSGSVRPGCLNQTGPNKEWYNTDWTKDIVLHSWATSCRMNDLIKEDKRIGHLAGPALLNNMHPDYAWGCFSNFLFSLDRKFEELIASTETQLFEGHRDEFTVIGVHIRTGDIHLADTGMTEDFTHRWRMYEVCLDLIEKLYELTTVKWLIASDTPAIVDYTKRLWPEKVVSAEVKIGHYSQLDRLSESEGLEIERSLLLEHHLLSKCDILLIPLSGFSLGTAPLGFFGYNEVISWDQCRCQLDFHGDYKGPVYRDNSQGTIEPGRWPRGNVGDCLESKRGDEIAHNLMNDEKGFELESLESFNYTFREESAIVDSQRHE